MIEGFETRALTPETFADLETLFEARGGPSYCWCRVWRAALPGMNEGTAAERRDCRKTALKQEVSSGVRTGLIGYVAGRPVGWVSCGWRESFVRLNGGPEAGKREAWSVVCFYVPTADRRQGISDHLLSAAVEAGRGAGARWVEVYPVGPDSPSFRFMGFVPQIARAGFDDLGPLGKRRRVMRLSLQDT